MVSKDVKPMNLEEQEIMDGFLLSTQCGFSQSKIDFLLRLVGTQCGQDCRHGCGKLVFMRP